MWGSDYPHLEGTWPNTMKALNETFALYPEQEIRDILGLNAANAYGFDVAALAPVAERIGPTLSAVRGH
jgi:predicted TIM-barrel fold metal-dependent hydrolase